MFTGTVQSQVSLQMLDLKWKKKKQDINNKKTENMTQDQILMQNLEEQAAAARRSARTSEIYNKLKSGGTLTGEERAYLQEHDPEALADYDKAQAEKKAYEKAMKNCKTKEEVDRLKFNKLGSFAAEAKSIANNPYIPKDKKLELMNKLNNRVCCIRDAHLEFVKSRAYEELPEEAELAEARAEEASDENDEILAEQMEADEEVKEDNADISSAIADETTSDVLKNETAKVSFEQVSQEIDKYVRKNGLSKPSFVRRL